MANKRHGKGPAIPPGVPPNPGISLNPANNDGGVIVKVLEEPWSLPELRKSHKKLATKVDSLAEMVTTLSSQLQSFLSKQAESETQSHEDHIYDSDDEDQHQTSQSDNAPETQPTPIADIDAKLKSLKLKYASPSSSAAVPHNAVKIYLHIGGNTPKAKWIVSNKLTPYSFVKSTNPETEEPAVAKLHDSADAVVPAANDDSLGDDGAEVVDDVADEFNKTEEDESFQHEEDKTDMVDAQHVFAEMPKSVSEIQESSHFGVAQDVTLSRHDMVQVGLEKKEGVDEIGANKDVFPRVGIGVGCVASSKVVQGVAPHMATQGMQRGQKPAGIKEQFAQIKLYVLTDGRDVLDDSSVKFAETLEEDLVKLREKGVDAQIASGGGRMNVTLDRYENDWSVVKRGWDAQVLGEAPYKFKSDVEAIKTLRAEPKANDQYLPPFVIVDDSGKPVGPIVDGDAVVTFNFRADRMVMAAKAFEYADFDKFDRVRVPKICYAGMLQYDGELKLPNRYLVEPPEIDRTSGEYLTYNGVRTFSCSETVQFGHVTFFWNGNRSGYFNPQMEEYVEIPSDSGISFNVQPKMKAVEIAEKARDAILSKKFEHVCVNLPNGDMVGHTGDIEATIVACKAADEAVKIILDAIEQVGGIYVVTADHGNAEDMVKRNKTGQPLPDKSGNIQILTSHTLQPVPIDKSCVV